MNSLTNIFMCVCSTTNYEGLIKVFILDCKRDKEFNDYSTIFFFLELNEEQMLFVGQRNVHVLP